MCLPKSGSAQLRINEVCASNNSVIADEDGDFEDWIELYNAGGASVSLGGLFISDDDALPLKYVLPEMSVGPGEFVILWASGKNRIGEGGEIHCNFQISSSGEPIVLSHADGDLIDYIPPVNLGTNISYGPQTDGEEDYAFFAAPSPGVSNAATPGFDTYLSAPELLTPAGIYASPFDLFASHADPEAVLRYSIDGSVPHEGSSLYNGAIEILSMLGEPDGISSFPTTSATAPEWYRWYAPAAPVYKGTTVRIRAFRQGAIPSVVTSATYIVDPEGHGRYSLPLVALTLPESSLFGIQGIYSNHQATGIEWEREAHFELFDPNGNLQFESPIGLRTHGGNSRRFALKSLRIYFRNSLGEDALEHNIFSQGTIHRHERLLLRNSGSDWNRSYFRDAFAQQLLHGYANLDYMRYQPAITFVNGEYWGVMNVRERLDDNYIRNHFGYESHEIDMLENISTPVYGSNTSYLSLRAFWQSADLSVADNYAYVASQMDINNFRDYHITQIFAMNTDQPGKNVRFWKPKQEGGKWRWMLFDLDDSFSFGPHCSHERNGLVFCSGLNNINSTVTNPMSGNPTWAPNGAAQTLPLRAMLRSPYFRPNFINRFADLLNTALLPARLHAMLDDFDAQISPYMQEHYERWHRPEPEFRAEHLALMHTFAEERNDIMRQHLISFFELDGSYPLTVAVSPPEAGHVKVNSILIHPDSVYFDAEGVYPWTGTYYTGVEVPITARAASGFAFSHWAENGSTDDTLWVNASEPVQYTAVFEDVAVPEPIHYWSFNNTPWYTAAFSIAGAEAVTQEQGNIQFITDEGHGFSGANSRFDAPSGEHLRINWPLDGALVIHIPTEGYAYPQLSFEGRRSGQGAGRLRIWLSVDGTSFQLIDSLEIYNDIPLVYATSLSPYAGTANNPELLVKFEFSQGEGGSAGNLRLDNVAVDAIPIDGNNLPPGFNEAIYRRDIIAGAQPMVIDLDALLSDPEGDVLGYTAVSDNNSILQCALNDNILQVNGIKAGEAAIELSVTDGVNHLVVHLRFMVHPDPAFIASYSAFAFNSWETDEDEGNFPEHMLFVQGAAPDPGLHSPLLYAYHIPHHDYHANDLTTIGQPYNNTARSRINGLGNDGISFLNTGRIRDLGGAVLAVNLSQMQVPAYVSWTGSTLLPNSRKYRIRLQYRTGISGPWQDVLFEGAPVEYERNDIPLHETQFSLVPLPAALLGEEYVQLMWRYYYTGEQLLPDVGARAQLRLDDIYVGPAELTGSLATDANFELVVYPNPTVDELYIFQDTGSPLHTALYGTDGKCVKRATARNQFNTMSLSDLPAGLYVLLLWDKHGNTARSKVVVID